MISEEEYKIALKYIDKYPTYREQIEEILNSMDFDMISFIMRQLDWSIRIGSDYRTPSSSDLITIASEVLAEAIYIRESTCKKSRVYIASLIVKCSKRRKLSLYFCPQFYDSVMRSPYHETSNEQSNYQD